jgi:hypothetical protein
MSTFNRGKLLRAAKAGKLFAKCDYRLTDDYAFDNANNFGKHADWLPVVINETMAEWKPGQINMTEWHFKTKSGGCYEHKGEITFYVHGNLSYTVKIAA